MRVGRHLILAGLAVLAVGARASAAPRRVMSLNLCTDQLVLALLPPERITSVSWLARDPAESRMAAAARRVGVNHGLAEEVVRDRPDLVVTGAYTAPAAQAMLRRLHYPVLALPSEDGFPDIVRDIRRVAAAVGEGPRGEAMVAAMEAELGRLRADPAPPLRVAAWDGAGFSARPGSLYDAVLRAAGARNVAAEAARSGAPDVEALLAAAPALLVVGAPGDEPPGRRSDTARHPLVRRLWRDRTVVVPQSAYLCGTPFSAQAARDLRDQMRARLAQARSPLPLPPPGSGPVRPTALAALAAAVLLAAAASVFAGVVWLSPAVLLHALLAREPSLTSLIVVEIRLPRVVLALLIGGALGLSGAVLQGLLRNPLAEPGLLGVSAGASLGAVIAIYYGFAQATALAGPLFGLAGGLVTAGFALLLARGGGTLSLILAGSAVSAVAAAGVSLALNLAPNPYAAYEITTWLLGSLSDRSWDHVALAAPFVLAGGALLLLTGRALDALALGEAQAESLGVDVRRARLLAWIGTSLAVGAATAVAGAIGFVGLVAPHLVRPLAGHQPGRVLVPAALAGALMVVLADTAVRTVRLGPEIKLGVVISLVGAPFFLWLVLHLRRVSP